MPFIMASFIYIFLLKTQNLTNILSKYTYKDKS
jgi:hypothetical protein